MPSTTAYELAPGRLLIADPFLKDPNFMRTVVLICDHREEGSFGFVLNRSYPRKLDELVPDFEGFPLPVFYGGPVQPDSLQFLHRRADLVGDGVQVSRELWWGGNFEQLGFCIRSGDISPADVRFFVGYSGWSEGQLDSEMKEKTWLVAPASTSIVFEDDLNRIWPDSLRLLGKEYEQVINYPIDPMLN